MKFTKDDAFKNLESYLTDNGRKPLLLSKRSVERQIETLMPLLAGEETELSVFVEQVKGTFKTMQDNLRYDNSQFVKKWEESHPDDAAPQVKSQESKVKNADGEGQEAVIQQLMARIDKMEQENAARAKAGAITAKRDEIAKAMEAKGVKDRAWVDEFLGEVTIGEETDVESTADKYLRIYNKGRAAALPADVTPSGAGAASTGGVPKSLEAAAAEMAKMSGVGKAAVEAQ